jgi:N-acetylglucosamine-6-sulfatase
MALNTDYMPTFANLTGAQIPPYVDGRTLKPVLDDSVKTWRSAVLPEAAAYYSPAYEGIRTIGTGGLPERKYVEYSGGAKELYNLDEDPMSSPTSTTPPRHLPTLSRACTR